MKLYHLLKTSALLTLLSFSRETSAQYIIHEQGENTEARSHTLILPYAFSTETLGFGLGIGATYKPKSYPHSLYYGTAYMTDNGSTMFMLGGSNLQIPRVKRLHIRPKFINSYFTHLRVYVDDPVAGPSPEGAGSNESSADDFLDEEAFENIIDLELRYTLPWGHYQAEPIHTYTTHNGLLKENPSGSSSWNPLESGRSTLLFTPYFRKQFTNVDELETLSFELGYEHDNRDFSPNPHRGYRFNTGISHDPDWLNNTERWTTLRGEMDAYIPLWDTAWSRQQTLALSFWSAYAPSFDSTSPDQEGKPPYFTGPTLGGLHRLRGYPSNRFHDKAAIHYAAEYRLMPEWQPLGKTALLDPLKIRWWQIVGLAEMGRVAPSWDLNTLHSDMKYDFGIGLRGMFNTSIGRLDLVISEEGFTFVAMLGQSF